MSDGAVLSSRADNERFRLLFEIAPVAISFTALDGTVREVNDAACSLFGRSREALVGMSVLDLVHPSDRAASAANVSSSADMPAKTIRVERRFVRPDGSIVWGDTSSLVVNGADGEPLFWLSIVIDITERKRREQFQAHQEAIVASSQDAMVGVSPDGKITTWNAAAERLLGYTAEEVVGTDGHFLLPPDQAEQGSEVLRRVRTGEHVRELEVVRMRKDGTPVAVSISALPMLDPASGAWTGSTSVIRDLSPQRQAAIIASSTDAIVAKTLAGIITSWNRGAELLYGYAAAEAIGQSIELVIPPEYRRDEALLLERISQGLPVPAYDTVRRRKDGSMVHVSNSASPILDEKGAVDGISAIARDISALVEADAGRREAERRIRAVVESAPISLIGFDIEGRVTVHEIGRSLREHVAIPRAHVGETLEDMAGDQPELLARLRRVLSGESFRNQVETEGRTLEISWTPTLTASGEPDGMIALAVDITERARAEQEREALQTRLRQTERLQALGQLAGGVAHDFNNLLAVILNLGQLVRESVAADPQASVDIGEIIKAAERAAQLTKQLLIFGRQDPGAPEVIDVNDVVNGLHQLLRRTIGEHVELVVLPAEWLPPVRADKGRLEQVLVNLAVNARDAMPEGGTLTVETSAVTLDDEQTTGGLAPGTYVRLSVSDTGTGMSPEVLTHAFEPFYTTKEHGHGTGLGLATVYGIVADAGGRVALYSEGGLGTSAHVYLPASASPLSPATVETGRTDLGHNETILVVEDDPAVRAVTARLLERNGYSVLLAADAKEALALAATETFDLLLTDVLMPEMSGLDLVDQLAVAQPTLRVLFMSGYTRGVLGDQRGLPIGAALMQKPFDEHSLLSAVRDVLGRE